MVTFSFGLAHILAGNVGANLAYLIAQGRLDYYLVFPRNLMLHVVFSRMMTAAAGDLVFGVIAYLFTGLFHPLEILYFLMASVLAALVFAAYGIIAGSLAFYMGNAQNASQQMWGAMVTFALYPNSLFAGISRVLLFTLIPAGFVGGDSGADCAGTGSSVVAGFVGGCGGELGAGNGRFLCRCATL